jgi:hypothetical protein
VLLCLLAILYLNAAPIKVFAGDDAKDGTTASPDKIDASKPELTEGERWLLDRFKQLEKRVRAPEIGERNGLGEHHPAGHFHSVVRVPALRLAEGRGILNTTANGWFQIALFLLVVFLITQPLGIFMARVFSGQKTFLDPVLRPIEKNYLPAHRWVRTTK